MALLAVAALSLLWGSITIYFGYRLLRLFRCSGGSLLVGTALLFVFPCLFVSSYSAEADILLTAIASASIYYLTRYSAYFYQATALDALRLGFLAGLAAATKYNGLVIVVSIMIILAAHANPDGMELVSDWYMRKPDPKQRSTSGIPRLYQKYVGHDNNRDFYMMNQPESVNINRMLYREWFPQIVYNHHQTGPTGTVMFSPPFRDPFNYVYDPLVVNMLDQVGSAMHARFDQEGKPGVTTR